MLSIKKIKTLKVFEQFEKDLLQCLGSQTEDINVFRNSLMSLRSQTSKKTFLKCLTL